ncbi:hypothetical protein [Peribacillus sp. SCS-155]|uniref:hypothetical protein n=1 Tax=Peribacillus sedimenti TaxID=3115297 RepID=UPI003906154A
MRKRKERPAFQKVNRKKQGKNDQGRPYYELSITYLDGANIFGPGGKDRAYEDIQRAAELWEVDFVIKEIIDGSGRNNSFRLKPGFSKKDLVCGASFGRNQALLSLLKTLTHKGRSPNHIIHIIYTGFASFADGETAGCAFPLQMSRWGNSYHFILLTNSAGTASNRSLCAHELGHTFYRTARFQRNIDPTTLIYPFRRPDVHSHLEDNVMYPVPGSNSSLLKSQKEKAWQSSLLIKES